MTPSRISIVLPVHNEAADVAVVVGEYEQACRRLPAPCELILVVNGSTDRSLEVCRGLEERLDPVRVVTSEPRGWGRAVQRGLEVAQGDILCYTNLARTTPEDLTLLLGYAMLHSDVVIKANRKIRDSPLRRIGSLLYNLECRTLFDLPYWDVNGTPKVFPRTLHRLLHLDRDDDLIDLEFGVVCRREGYRILEVPIFSTRRHSGRSTTGYRSAAKLYWGAIGLWRHLRDGTS